MALAANCDCLLVLWRHSGGCVGVLKAGMCDHNAHSTVLTIISTATINGPMMSELRRSRHLKQIYKLWWAVWSFLRSTSFLPPTECIICLRALSTSYEMTTFNWNTNSQCHRRAVIGTLRRHLPTQPTPTKDTLCAPLFPLPRGKVVKLDPLFDQCHICLLQPNINTIDGGAYIHTHVHTCEHTRAESFIFTNLFTLSLPQNIPSPSANNRYTLTFALYGTGRGVGSNCAAVTT